MTSVAVHQQFPNAAVCADSTNQNHRPVNDDLPKPTSNNKPANWLKKGFQVTNDPDGTVVVLSKIPHGLSIERAKAYEGNCIVTTKAFQKGDILYRAYAATLDFAHKPNWILRLYAHDGTYLRDAPMSTIQSVEDFYEHHQANTGMRQCYGFDANMNHSCDPNVFFPRVYRTREELCYDVEAIRDIAAGEEVTCDYACFDYTCDGHEIEACACGAAKCRGQMVGFKGLAMEDKIAMLHMCEEELKETFFKDEPNLVPFNSMVPEGIRVVTQKGDNHLVAAKTFAKGERVFANKAQLVSNDDLESKTFVLFLENQGHYILLDPEHHFVLRPEYAENLGFDSFMDHSCSPNTKQLYHNMTEYEVTATRTIHAGEKITCDYTKLDNQHLRVGNIPTMIFDCMCGASNCKGRLHC